MSLFSFVLFLEIVAVISQNNITAHQNIHCLSNEECNIECSNYRSCASIHCNNATKCNILCSARESCAASTIYHTSFNQQIEINCLYENSCNYAQLKYEPDLDVIITNNKSLTINSLRRSASSSILLSDIATFSDLNVNCGADVSCSGMEIEINNANFSNQSAKHLNLNMNIYCTGIESCKYMRLYVSDSWQNMQFTDVEWDDFSISLHCNNTQSCQYASIDTQKLKINSQQRSTDSFADLYIYCTDIDESCLFINVLCPELIPFRANYDYLYQPSKCHFSLNNSYENHITIISRHGVKMIDLKCDDNDESICDGITVYCTEDPNEYFCGMQYLEDNINGSQNASTWYCDNFDIFYVFNADYNYSYGCDEYLWYDNIAVIQTSKIPNYENDGLYAFMSCSKYNPLLSLNECYMSCDSENSCKSDIHCDNSTLCHAECTGLHSCYNDDSIVTIICPPSHIADSICSMVIDPLLLTEDYGKFYQNFFVYAYNGTSLDLSISHNMLAFIYDYGMKETKFRILSSDNLVNWTEKYDAESWWRIKNVNENATAPLSIEILCDHCYTDWVDLVGYDDKRNVSVHLSCIECAGTEFNFWGITSFEFDCYKNCSYSIIQFTDSNTNMNCYGEHACNGIEFIANPSNYSQYIDHKYSYNLNLLNVSLDIHLHSLYGFDELAINCYDNQTFCDTQSMGMKFYCGAPDYFNLYENYEDVNESQCLQSNPVYDAAVVALFEYEYQGETINSQIVYCTVFQSCRAAKIYCIGDDCVLHCDGIYSCIWMIVYVNYYIGNSTTKQRQNSLTIYCNDYKACYGMSIYGNDIDYIEINCMAGDSCDRSTIYYADALNPSRGLNITCFDLKKTQHILPADDIYSWPSCKRLTIYCPFGSKACHINLENSFYVNPWSINVYFAKGFGELDLNCFYNALNNQSTCYDVDYHCSLGDGKDPYNNSNYQYNSTFNQYNGQCIGRCCDFIFSHSPTAAPSNAPSLAPSQAPTYSPTESPTAAPTRYPTNFQFDAYFIAKFYIIINDKLNFIFDNAFIDVTRALEYSYLPSSATWSYSEYLVNITNFSFISNLNKFNVTMQMFSDSDVVTHYVQFTENNQDFDKSVADELQIKWNVSNISFDLYPGSVILYIPDNNIETLSDPDYGSIVFISFTSFIWLIGILSFIHTKNKLKCLNKIPSIKACDDQQYLGIIKFGMQILDLYSDIAFGWELYEFSKTLTNKIDTTLITVLYSLSFTFCFVPYTLNLLFAVMFEKIINAPIFNTHKNSMELSIFTRNYFFKFSKIFAILVIVSGSVSATLQLIHSRLFGHELFEAGFSKYRLSKMSKFRIMFTVLIENFPQFIIQLIYLIYFNGKQGRDVITFTFIVSTCSSIISILSTIMAYFLQRSNKPRYQTKFNIEIILVEGTKYEDQYCSPLYDRTQTILGDASKSILKIDVTDKNVKKLHKRSHLRKEIKKNVAKCIGKLADNFEFLYCIEQIDGLTLHGLCSSDDYKKLTNLFENHENDLQRIIIKMYQLDKHKMINKLWKVDFIVFDNMGRSKSAHGTELTEINPENKSIRIRKSTIGRKQNKNDTEEVVEYYD